MRVAVTSLLVASGVTVVGVVPALAAGDSPTSVAHRSDDDRDRGRDHDRWFRARGDVRYVWFRVCDTDATATTTATITITTTTTTTTTSETLAPDTTTETVAPDAIAAAVEGASTETATATDTVTTETSPETTTETTTEDDDADGEVYPTFIVVPLPKDEAKALRKLDDRPCYDLTTGAPATTDPTPTTTETATETATDAATVVETATATPGDTGTTG